MLRLHAEIVDFCRFLEPTAAEREAREGSVARVRAAVLAIWPGARFEVHGSFATGMYLPNSDVDAVILDSGAKAPATCLKALALSLSRKGMATDIQLIAKARVPIVKFIEKQSGFQFDISFDVANGPASAEIVRANTRRFPALRPLVTVLKAFLQQRALNEVYSGGIGSYALLCMVMAHLQLHDTKATASAWAGESGGKAAEEGCLGALLIDFFELYGRRVDTDEVGVSCRGGGRFFAKRDKSPSWAEPGRPFLFSIEDPQDPSNDLGRNSYAARSVKAAFDAAFTLLTAPAAKKDEFLLGRVVRADPETLRRRTPPPAAGAIVGVAADFARYAFAQPGDGPVGGGGRGTPAEHAARGRKRKAAETPARPDDARRRRRRHRRRRRRRRRRQRRTTQAGTSTTRPGLTRRTTTPTVDRRHPLPRPRVRKRKARWRACRTKGEAAEGAGAAEAAAGERAAAGAPRAAAATRRPPRTSVGRRARAAAVGDTSPKADRIDRDSLKRFVLGVIRVQVQSYRSDTSPSSTRTTRIGGEVSFFVFLQRTVRAPRSAPRRALAARPEPGGARFRDRGSSRVSSPAARAPGTTPLYRPSSEGSPPPGPTPAAPAAAR